MKRVRKRQCAKVIWRSFELTVLKSRSKVTESRHCVNIIWRLFKVTVKVIWRTLNVAQSGRLAARWTRGGQELYSGLDVHQKSSWRSRRGRSRRGCGGCGGVKLRSTSRPHPVTEAARHRLVWSLIFYSTRMSLYWCALTYCSVAKQRVVQQFTFTQRSYWYIPALVYSGPVFVFICKLLFANSCVNTLGDYLR